MSSLICQLSISVDGFVAGPNQSMENPLGEGGMALHEWVFTTKSWRAQHGMDGGEPGPDSDVVEELTQGIGAYLMGRKMFGGGDGPWDDEWNGWWDDDPPFRVPVFVLTHHQRAPLTLNDTTFTFVTDGFRRALQQAREAAGEKNVAIGGGASVVRQALVGGELDELHLHVVPIILGAGERLFDNVGQPTLEQASVVTSSAVTHLKYRVVR